MARERRHERGIAAARALSEELGSAKNLLVPLDQALSE
jgi:hypothetical protein